jgi:hypothetical protein
MFDGTTVAFTELVDGPEEARLPAADTRCEPAEAKAEAKKPTKKQQQRR